MSDHDDGKFFIIDVEGDEVNLEEMFEPDDMSWLPAIKPVHEMTEIDAASDLLVRFSLSHSMPDGEVFRDCIGFSFSPREKPELKMLVDRLAGSSMR